MQGTELKAWRQGTGVTLDRVAAVVKVNRETVRNWERGLTPIPEWAVSILKSLMTGDLKVESTKPVDLSGVSDLDLLKELEMRARQRQRRGIIL